MPMTVFTLPVGSNGTARIELPSLSATYSQLPSDARPLGWAKLGEAFFVGLCGSSGPSTMSSRPLPA